MTTSDPFMRLRAQSDRISQAFARLGTSSRVARESLMRVGQIGHQFRGITINNRLRDVYEAATNSQHRGDTMSAISPDDFLQTHFGERDGCDTDETFDQDSDLQSIANNSSHGNGLRSPQDSIMAVVMMADPRVDSSLDMEQYEHRLPEIRPTGTVASLDIGLDDPQYWVMTGGGWMRMTNVEDAAMTPVYLNDDGRLEESPDLSVSPHTPVEHFTQRLPDTRPVGAVAYLHLTSSVGVFEQMHVMTSDGWVRMNETAENVNLLLLQRSDPALGHDPTRHEESDRRLVQDSRGGGPPVSLGQHAARLGFRVDRDLNTLTTLIWCERCGIEVGKIQDYHLRSVDSRVIMQAAEDTMLSHVCDMDNRTDPTRASTSEYIYPRLTPVPEEQTPEKTSLPIRMIRFLNGRR